VAKSTPQIAALQQIDHENLSSKTYRQLRQALLEGRFEPGQRLRIGSLAEMLGTSITPVREAIFRLASEKALELKAATAIYVSKSDAKRLEEVMTIRLHLEGEAAAAAARRITRRQLLELRALQEELIEHVVGDPEQASVLNRQFHFRILDISGMPTLAAIVENLWVTTGPFMRLFHTRMPTRETAGPHHRHFSLLAALETNDADKARGAIQADIRWGAVMIDWARDLEADAAPERGVDEPDLNDAPVTQRRSA
jgi:DNA-binding GntR family transcriptional regulator